MLLLLLLLSLLLFLLSLLPSLTCRITVAPTEHETQSSLLPLSLTVRHIRSALRQSSSTNRPDNGDNCRQTLMASMAYGMTDDEREEEEGEGEKKKKKGRKKKRKERRIQKDKRVSPASLQSNQVPLQLLLEVRMHPHYSWKEGLEIYSGNKGHLNSSRR